MRALLRGEVTGRRGGRRVSAAVWVACCLGLVAIDQRSAQASPVLPFDRNLEALGEAAVMSLAMVENGLGKHPAALSFSGSVEDAGWQMNLTGFYGGNALNLAFLASYDSATETGTFDVNGDFGGGLWTGAGTYSFGNVSVDTVAMSWMYSSVVATLVRPEIDTEFGFNQPVNKTLTCQDLFHEEVLEECFDSGRYLVTVLGVPEDMPRFQESHFIRLKEPPPDLNDPRVISFDLQLPDDSIALSGGGTISTGGVGGLVRVVSAPSSLSLLASGLVLLLAVKWPQVRWRSSGRARALPQCWTYALQNVSSVAAPETKKARAVRAKPAFEV